MTILGGMVLAAALAAPEAATVASTGRVCGGITVTSPDKVRARGTFSAHKTLDLVFRMTARKADDDPHLVTFRILTPQGNLYQEVRVGYQVAPGKSVATVEGRLPLAGTAIPTNALYGRWKVVPHLDGNPVACAAGTVFTIAK